MIFFSYQTIWWRKGPNWSKVSTHFANKIFFYIWNEQYQFHDKVYNILVFSLRSVKVRSELQRWIRFLLDWTLGMIPSGLLNWTLTAFPIGLDATIWLGGRYGPTRGTLENVTTMDMLQHWWQKKVPCGPKRWTNNSGVLIFFRRLKSHCELYIISQSI